MIKGDVKRSTIRVKMMNISGKHLTYYKVTRTFKVCGRTEKENVVGNCYYKKKSVAVDAAKRYIKKIESYSESKFSITSDGKYPFEAMEGNEKVCCIIIRVEELSPEEREKIVLSKFLNFIKSPSKLEE